MTDSEADPIIEALHEISSPLLAETEHSIRMPEPGSEARPGVVALTRDECRKHLAGGYLGRVAFLEEGRPVVLPVNYELDGEDIVFRTDPGAKLAAALRRAPAAFEIDEINETYHEGWSVVVQGIAEEIVEASDLARLLSLPLRPWAEGEKGHWIRIRTTKISGRRLGRD